MDITDMEVTEQDVIVTISFQEKEIQRITIKSSCILARKGQRCGLLMLILDSSGFS